MQQLINQPYPTHHQQRPSDHRWAFAHVSLSVILRATEDLLMATSPLSRSRTTRRSVVILNEVKDPGLSSSPPTTRGCPISLLRLHATRVGYHHASLLVLLFLLFFGSFQIVCHPERNCLSSWAQRRICISRCTCLSFCHSQRESAVARSPCHSSGNCVPHLPDVL